jgi:hypothetical protein
LTDNNQRILMGNEALGRGIVESGVTLAASYPNHAEFGDIFPPFLKGGLRGDY